MLAREATIPPKDVYEASKLTKEEWREYTKTVWHIANVTHPEHPAVFPSEIPRRLIKLFSFVGETVMDPFAGVGTTVEAAVQLDRAAIGVDQNADYVRIMRRLSAAARIVKADSSKLDFLPDESVGLIVTSPPYWNKADYGNHASNLGKIRSYAAFLRRMRPALVECYRVLRPGRKMCLITANVNQHTEHGLLTFPLASDFTQILREIGFVMVNELIWSKDGTGGRWGSWGAQRPIFGSYPYPPNFLFKNVHEYILVFAKPSAQKRTGSTVVNYVDLMSDPDSVTDCRLPIGKAAITATKPASVQGIRPMRKRNGIASGTALP